MIICGIDPGQTGALAFISSDGISLYDMPVSARIHGKGQEVTGAELASLLLEYRPDRVMLEVVAAMPKQGVSSVFRFGESYGIVKGVVQALQIPLIGVTPQKWKKQAGLLGMDKDVARTMAIQHHPELSDQLCLKKHGGRADALWIAKSGV